MATTTRYIYVHYRDDYYWNMVWNSMASAILLVLLSVILFNARDRGTAGTLIQNLLRSSCAGNYSTGNNTFRDNLDALFSSLTDRAPISNFYNTTAGDGADRAYGLYMCQGDLSSDECRGCIEAAAAGILQSCPSNRQGIIWYDYCQLRFSDYSFFGIMDARGYDWANEETVFNPSLPLHVLSRLVEDAPSRPLKFAANASVTAAVYAMAQCTDDLSRGDCGECLRTILQRIRGCCSSFQGYRFLSPSCWVRYEATPFLRNVNGTSTFIIVPRCHNDSFPQSSSRAWEANLGALFSSLASNSAQNSGFNSSSTAGVGSARLYGLALCRGDIANSTVACQTCLTNASSSMTQICPQKTQGIIWYEQCELRYSNESFFGVVDQVAGPHFCGTEGASQVIDSASVRLMTRLVEEAPNEPLMFAAGSVAMISNTESSYGLVQCTRDLGSEDCRSCLRGGMANVLSKCPQTRGWRYLSGSCNLRYEKFAFFDTSVASTMPNVDSGSGNSSKARVTAIVIPIFGAILLVSLIYLLWQRKRTHRIHGPTKAYLDDLETLGDTDLHLVDLGTIREATDNFSEINKIGEGGFGTVYKGTLKGGEEIAVKRLSARSNQGTEEFKNEVILIAKLQHRNLLRISGCCLDREEKMLIYDYMPNGSLDAFIFDERNRASLGWKSRFNIIAGIARGLLYLHEDSQLKIIHRDLKPSNVLLDHDMNPKISDFGMARIFRHDEDGAWTGKVVGTYGYIAPEYVMDGVFSLKSDVYSFGVLLLEILSGQKNGRSHFLKHGVTLLKHAWQLRAEGRGFQLVDPYIAESCPASEAVRCIHIGLLCVQEDPEDRPTMSSVVLMLMSDQTELREPLQPPTFVREVADAGVRRRSSSQTVNYVSITDVGPR